MKGTSLLWDFVKILNKPCIFKLGFSGVLTTLLFFKGSRPVIFPCNLFFSASLLQSQFFFQIRMAVCIYDFRKCDRYNSRWPEITIYEKFIHSSENVSELERSFLRGRLAYFWDFQVLRVFYFLAFDTKGGTPPPTSGKKVKVVILVCFCPTQCKKGLKSSCLITLSDAKTIKKQIVKNRFWIECILSYPV